VDGLSIAIAKPAKFIGRNEFERLAFRLDSPTVETDIRERVDDIAGVAIVAASLWGGDLRELTTTNREMADEVDLYPMLVGGVHMQRNLIRHKRT
jgi:hypothetical protein